MAPEIEALLEEELRISYIDYAMSVIVGRALPDIRDGLKPVQRRILFAMRNLGLVPGRPYRKSATVVGEVIGKYHPHGDGPVYDALVRMAQDFSLRYPLVDGQGNFGSIDGDPPAAYRYTEARLTPVAMELLENLDEDTVDFVPNFDGRLQEPVVLPAKFPNLLANGSAGIAVGMATNIPPHNLRELVDALILLLEDPEVDDEELLRVLKGPDFPTGGLIMGTRGIRDAYLTGRGKILVRSRYHIEEKKNHLQIVITEIPYGLSKTLLIESIARLVRDKRVDGIADLRDETDREGLRVVIELKRGANPDIVVNQLLKHTPMQTTFGIILIALSDGEPRLFTLREMLAEYLQHRETVIERRTRYRLKKAEDRAHILEGLLKALDAIDEVITIIRHSASPQEARQRLIQTFEFTEKQAQAILDMRLQTLTGLEREKVQAEYQDLQKKITDYREILESRPRLLLEIRKELEEIREKYGDARRTEIVPEEPEDFDITDLIPDEEVVVTLTYQGYAKRTHLKSYRQQARGGVGKAGIKFYEEDFPVAVFVCRTHDQLLILTDRGRAYTLATYLIHEAGLRARGRPLRGLISLEQGERIVAMIPVRDFSQDPRQIFLATEEGVVKRVGIRDFQHAGRRGIWAQRLREGDRLVAAVPVRDDHEIILAKADGRAVRFPVSEVRVMGRTAMGVRGTRTTRENRVVSCTRVVPGKLVLTVTEFGYGKRVPTDQIRRTHRGGKGVIVQKITPKTGRLVRLSTVDSKDEIILLTQQGNTIRTQSGDIRIAGRNTQGVRLVRLREGDRVVDLAVIEHDEGKTAGELFS